MPVEQCPIQQQQLSSPRVFAHYFMYDDITFLATDSV
jgi:hypothetical protein